MNFREEFNKIINKIESGEHFGLARYGDGEHMLIEGRDVGKGTQAQAQDKRESYGFSLLGKDLGQTLDIVDDNYYYAIPCQCCNDNGKQWYMRNIKSQNLTYANIFINGNYQEFKKWIENTKKSFHIIGNYEGLGKKYPFDVKSYGTIGDDCVNVYEKEKNNLLDMARNIAKNSNDKIFLISAGPLANIFVYEMWKINKNNTYIDVGSALDEYTKGRITRGFQRPGDFYSNRICIF